MMKRKTIALMLAVVMSATGGAMSQSRPSYVPPDGFVPNAETAIRIAEAVWVPIWGEQHVASKRPLTATLNGDVWTVRGSLPRGVVVGGVPEADISKHDGRILRVVHSQ